MDPTNWTGAGKMREDQFELLRPMIDRCRSRSPVTVRSVCFVMPCCSANLFSARQPVCKPIPVMDVTSFIDKMIAEPGHDAAISLKGPRAATRAIACGRRTMDDAAKWIEEARRAAILAHCAGSLKSLK